MRLSQSRILRDQGLDRRLGFGQLAGIECQLRRKQLGIGILRMRRQHGFHQTRGSGAVRPVEDRCKAHVGEHTTWPCRFHLFQHAHGIGVPTGPDVEVSEEDPAVWLGIVPGRVHQERLGLFGTIGHGEKPADCP